MTVDTRPHVLIIDDDVGLAELLAMRLETQRYRVTIEGEATAGLARVAHEHVDALVLDLRLADADGLDVLSRLQDRAPELPVVILTAHGTIETAVEAMERGAYGFLTKPFQDHELLQKLAHAVERSTLRREVAELRRRMGEGEEGLVVGVSEAIAHVREVIRRVAPTDVNVLITGESGTGKGLAARALHALSPRRAARFVAVNCGALPPELLESELFGHVKGAFTGAVRDREGLFGAARGGTLFLDEIGEAPLGVQVKLLRAIEERRVTRVGSDVEDEVDVRILAATNRDLSEEVAARRFREDLFYRLHVVPLAVPPLRERGEDVPLLAQLFLERAASRYDRRPPHLTRETMALLLSHPWPGNVRELMHELEAALLLSNADELRPEHFPRLLQRAQRPAGSATSLPDIPRGGDGEPLPTLKEARDAFERAYLAEVLRRSGGNVTAAARMAGRNRSDLYDLLRRHDLSPATFKQQGESD